MKLKTYRAQSMALALAAVKADLGKDAVILHTRSFKSGGLLGLRRKSVVEVTACDEPPAQRRKALTTAAIPDTRPAVRAERDTQAPQITQTVPATAPAPMTAAPAAARAYARHSPVSAAAIPQRIAVAAAAAVIPAAAPPPAEPAAPEPAAVPGTVMRVRPRRVPDADSPAALAPSHDFRRELADIKLLVTQVLRSSAPASGLTPPGTTPDALFAEYLRLLESQVSREIADRIVGAVRDELNAGELGDDGIVRATVLRHLASMIPVADVPPARPPAHPATRGHARAPFVVALVGPTGVGKTTTIAKLAAAYKLRQGRSVALITSDTYRIAAVDQVRTYAGIIGLPLRVVLTPGEMAAAIESLASFDIILIDTAGRSQHNTERLAELSEFLAAARPDETHLVLSSTAAPEVLFSAAEAFAVVKPNRLILTKLDEAVHFGVVVNIMDRLSTRLSFVTTGQEVPDHIEAGQPERLARLILDNKPSTASAPSARPQPLRSASPLLPLAAAAS